MVLFDTCEYFTSDKRLANISLFSGVRKFMVWRIAFSWLGWKYCVIVEVFLFLIAFAAFCRVV